MTVRTPVEGLCPLVQVFDMPAALVFYRDLLGFQIVQQAPAGTDRCDWAWLRLNDAELMLNTQYEADSRPAAPDAARQRAHGDTSFFFGCRDLDGLYAELRASGLPVEPPRASSYGMRQLFLSDPDGYGLCFQWPEATHGS